MVIEREIQSAFKTAAESIPRTDFANDLQTKFGMSAHTVLEVLNVFEKMGIPAPQNDKEFLTGEEGLLAFSNKGVVIRVEKTRFKFDYAVRIDDDPAILKPLASIKAGEAIIEIMPGGSQETEQKNIDQLERQLKERGIKFWDKKFSNVGRIPTASGGITVVIDRGAVTRLKNRIHPVRKLLINRRKKAAEQRGEGKELEALYAPLRQAFEEAWADMGKMKQFWELCQSYADQGKLIAGWNEPQPHEAVIERVIYDNGELGDNTKTPQAAEAAKHYAARLQSSVSSVARAVPRSPRPPV